MYDMGVGMNGRSVYVDEDRSIVLGVLNKYYGRMYGSDLCEAMADQIMTRIYDGTFMTRGDIMHYVWCNTSGSGVAEMSSTDIQAALPHLLQDTDRRSRKGVVV